MARLRRHRLTSQTYHSKAAQMTTTEVVILVRNHCQCSVAEALAIVQRAAKPEVFTCRPDPGNYNATLTFITGDSYKVMAVSSLDRLKL